MISIDDLRFVDALSRGGSLSAAARSLNLTPSALSMRLKRLETSLGINLVVRSSRRVRFTNEGERLVHEAQNLLERIDCLPDALAGQGRSLTGRLHVVAPFGFGRMHVAPGIARFSTQNPGLHVTLDLSERPWVDGHDADVVVHIGKLRDSSWTAHLLARNSRWVCASPEYIRRHRVPASPRDLQSHPCLCLRENDEDVTLWRCSQKSAAHATRSRAETIRVSPVLVSNDGEVVRNWATAGLGFVLRSQWDVAPLVRAGRLRRVLQGWDFGSADVFALVPARRGVSARVSRFVESLRAEFHPRPPWASPRAA
jgi:DNA-binding transcriptional LysR family regulator